MAKLYLKVCFALVEGVRGDGFVYPGQLCGLLDGSLKVCLIQVVGGETFCGDDEFGMFGISVWC